MTIVAVVGVREVAVLLAELGRRDQVVPQLRRVARPGELRADDVLALGIAIEQQPVGPDDVFAGEPAGMVCAIMSRHRNIGRVAPPLRGRV